VQVEAIWIFHDSFSSGCFYVDHLLVRLPSLYRYIATKEMDMNVFRNDSYMFNSDHSAFSDWNGMNRVNAGSVTAVSGLAPEVNICFGTLLEVYMVVEVH
jgi:hypothetical protein